MKFGLIYEMNTPLPHSAAQDYRVYWEALEQICLAEDVGFDYAWEVEHHFLTEYSHSSAPEVFLGAVTQRTKRIRIGSGIVQLPHRFNHPAKVAERAAVLDILSNGRYDLGTGRSITEAELGGFEINPADSKAQWEEFVSLIPKMWKSTADKPFSFKGKYLDMPPRHVLPKPIQSPHPPLWVAATQPMTFRQAGERGLGVLCFGFNAAVALGEQSSVYWEALKNPTLQVGDFINPNLAASVPLYCHSDRRQARMAGIPASAYFAVKALQLFSPWYGKEIPGYEYYTQMANRGQADFGVGRDGKPMDMDRLVSEGTLLVGTPDEIGDAIEKYEKAGVTQMVFLVQMGSLPHRDILRSLELFGKEVIPHFRARGHQIPYGFREFQTSVPVPTKEFGAQGLDDVRPASGTSSAA
ncbi:MAG: LLM class flavin-dependent oxidoreductase [Deltaproteobacteria bacterium]|nr:LLM class flavin-dependent oxidoreductase [Deltaproteobacteria bacterium]